MLLFRESLRPQLPRTKMFALLLQIVVASLLLEAHLKKASAAMLPASDSNSNLNGMDGNNMDLSVAEKRRWKNLQGAWGKRNWNDDDLIGSGESGNDESPEGEEVIFPDRWIPVLMANGERYDPQTKYSVVYVANANIRPHPIDDDNDDLLSAVNKALDIDTNASIDEDILLGKNNNINNNNNSKRSWKSMSVAWGKRRNAPTWNKFRGAWGKREPGWNNLKGMWGKRTSKDWQKLYSGWGKRSLN